MELKLPLGEEVPQRRVSSSSQDEQYWEQPLSRHLPRDDRHTLLQLMSDPLYQHTKLGGSFSPARQQRRQGFWRAAAAYLQQPLARVMQAGMRLRSDADRLWELHQQQERRQLQAQRPTEPAPAVPAAAAADAQSSQQPRHTPVVEPPTAAASATPTAAKPPGKHQRRHSSEAAAAAEPATAAAVPRRGSGGAAVAEPASGGQGPATKKRRSTEAQAGSSASAAVEAAPAMPVAEVMAEGAGDASLPSTHCKQLPHHQQQEQQQAPPVACPLPKKAKQPKAPAAPAPAVVATRPAPQAEQEGEPPAEPEAGAAATAAAADAAIALEHGAFASLLAAPPSSMQAAPGVAGGRVGSAAAAAVALSAAPPQAAAPAAMLKPAAQQAAGERHRWHDDEVAELVRLAEDEAYRLQRLGTSKRSWVAIGRQFGVGANAVKRCYFAARCRAMAGPPSKPAPRIPGLFPCMVESVLRAAHDRSATRVQICHALSTDPAYAGLFTKLLPAHFQVKRGHLNMPRWHNSVAYALRCHPGIEQTGERVGRAVVWRLRPDAEWAGSEQAQQQPKKRSAGTPLLGKNNRSPN